MAGTMLKDERRLKVGILGCGAIAQAAHFESATKAHNVELYAICDVADDLLWWPFRAVVDPFADERLGGVGRFVAAFERARRRRNGVRGTGKI